jgi:hypothetical protein
MDRRILTTPKSMFVSLKEILKKEFGKVTISTSELVKLSAK